MLASCMGHESSNQIQIPLLASSIESQGASDAAFVSGKIVLKDRCLYLLNDQNDIIFPIFSTPQTYFDQQNRVLFINQQMFKQGSRLIYGNPEPFELKLENYQWLHKPDNSCDTRKTVLITNAFLAR